MCCRYYYDVKAEEAIYKAISMKEDKSFLHFERDIYPSESAPVIAGIKKEADVEEMKWGFPSMIDGKLLINARSETALEKKSFADSALNRRCIIPAALFYEWDRSKNKHMFYLPEKTIYMAGIYKQFEDGWRYCILTTAANASMSPVHDRMPLILSENDIERYIFDNTKIAEYLKHQPPMLENEAEFEQMSIMDLL